MWFDLDTFVLDAAQALCVALPAAGIPAFLLRLGGRGWALVAPLSVVVSVVAIAAAAASADVLTWIAFLLVPVGCALALGWRRTAPVLGWRSRSCRSWRPRSRRPTTRSAVRPGWS
jgi:hypothetical protein